MSLKDRLIEQITLEGPMTVADYMAACLMDPRDGYYATRPAIGAEGDFITAPMISQMFGEMIGVWVAQVWQELGSPERFQLVEIGGGDGTLMSDVLRVAAQVAGLKAAARVVMIEPSAPLRALQKAQVPDAEFLADIDALDGDMPVILVANEVLDCLPSRQFIRTDAGWFERCIGVDNDHLIFGLVAAGGDFMPPFEAPLGEIVEVSAGQKHLTRQVALLLKKATGAALLIDYGRDEPGTGDTLQTLFRHEKRDPLEAPGEHDLTNWADFPAVAAAASECGVKVSRIVTQTALLQALGIDARHAALAAKNPGHAPVLQRQYERLIADDQMGTLFKAVGLAYPPQIPLHGLEHEPA